MLVYNVGMTIEELFKKNYSNKEIAKELNCSLSTVKRYLRNHNLRRTYTQRSMIQSRTVKEAIDAGRMTYKCGDENPAKRPEVRKKISEGVNKSINIIKSKRANTLLNRYGVDNAFKSNEFKAKIAKTNLKKYGVKNPLQNQVIKEKAIAKSKETLAIKYNHVSRIEDIKQEYERLGRKLTPQEMIKLWNCAQSNAYIFMHKYHLEDYVELGYSKFENDVEAFIKTLNVKYIKNCRSIITPKEIDFFIPEYNVGIEVNDVDTHSITKNTYGGEVKKKGYHYMKSKMCEEKGIRLIHVWEYEWYNERQNPILKSIIAGACNQSKSIYARKCKVEITESAKMKDFFEKNNIQGFRGGKYAINLVYEDEVVMSYIIGFPFFGKGKYQWEVIRGATKLNHRVIGGATRIWKHFLKEFNPESCVYYIDYNYFNGNSIKKLGLEYICTRPSFKNYFVKEKKVRNRQPAHHNEIKKLVEQGKVYEIYNAGVKVYLYKK